VGPSELVPESKEVLVSIKWMSATLALVVGSTTWAAAPKSTPALIEKGKASYATNCLACHGEKGEGNGPTGQYLAPKPRNFVTEPFKKGNKPEEVFKSISDGLPGSTMVSFGKLPEEERWALTYYVLNFQPKAKPAAPKKAKK
jgi:mono/diheme cytochrome c family protein